MWKKAAITGLFSLTTLGTLGCHSNHQSADQPAMQKEDEKSDQQVAIADLPPKVLKTVHHRVPNGTIVSAETSEWNGKEIYEIDVRSGNMVYEVKVHRKGKFISKNVDSD